MWRKRRTPFHFRPWYGLAETWLWRVHSTFVLRGKTHASSTLLMRFYCAASVRAIMYSIRFVATCAPYCLPSSLYLPIPSLPLFSSTWREHKTYISIGATIAAYTVHLSLVSIDAACCLCGADGMHAAFPVRLFGTPLYHAITVPFFVITRCLMACGCGQNAIPGWYMLFCALCWFALLVLRWLLVYCTDFENRRDELPPHIFLPCSFLLITFLPDMSFQACMSMV